MNTTKFSPPQDNKKSRRSRGALAGLTILGLGMAITTAAFTQDVLFQTSVEVARFDIAVAVTTNPDDTPTWTLADKDAGTADLIFTLLDQPWRSGVEGAVTKYLWVRDVSGAATAAVTGAISLLPGVDGLTLATGTWDAVSTDLGPARRAPLTMTATTSIAAGTTEVRVPVSVTGDGTVPAP